MLNRAQVEGSGMKVVALIWMLSISLRAPPPPLAPPTVYLRITEAWLANALTPVKSLVTSEPALNVLIGVLDGFTETPNW